MKEAVPYLKRARELDPDRPMPVLALGKAYVALRQYDAANECYRRAVGLDDNSAEAWYGLGVTYRSRAEALLNRAARQGNLQNNPDKASIDELLNNALKALTRAAELDPNSARPFANEQRNSASSAIMRERLSSIRQRLQFGRALRKRPTTWQ